MSSPSTCDRIRVAVWADVVGFRRWQQRENCRGTGRRTPAPCAVRTVRPASPRFDTPGLAQVDTVAGDPDDSPDPRRARALPERETRRCPRADSR